MTIIGSDRGEIITFVMDKKSITKSEVKVRSSLMESLEDVCRCRNCSSKARPNVSRWRRSLESSTLSC